MKWLLFWFLHLFELDETLLAADGFTAVLRIQHEEYFGAEAATGVTNRHRQVVDSAVVDEAGVAANSVDHAVQGQVEFALRTTKEHVDVNSEQYTSIENWYLKMKYRHCGKTYTFWVLFIVEKETKDTINKLFKDEFDG